MPRATDAVREAGTLIFLFFLAVGPVLVLGRLCLGRILHGGLICGLGVHAGGIHRPLSVAPLVFSGRSMPLCGAGPAFWAMTDPDMAANAIVAMSAFMGISLVP